jgi:hypothetical protein
MNVSIRLTLSLLIVYCLMPTVCGQACDCARPAAVSSVTSVMSPVASVCGQEYRLVYKTVCEQKQMTAYKIEYETSYEERPVTTYKPIWETQMREERYTVAKPVTESSEREERYTVQKPVWETQMRDNSYTRIRYVQETAEREERYTVNRPITETAEREEAYTVLKPVYETSARTETYTVMRPQTICQTQMIDRGGFIDQTVMKPEAPATRLRWMSGTNAVDPATGQTVYQRSGLYWVQVPRTTCEVQKVWQPNIVPQQVQQTFYAPQVESRQVPVQTVRYEQERVVRKVPVTTCRIVQEEVVKKIPYTVMRPVEERVEQQVPVQVCHMVTEEQVRKIPVTTCRMVYEERVEQKPVQVYKMVAVQGTVRVPHCVEKRTPVTYTYNVPHVVCYREPIGPCGEPLNVTAPETSIPTSTSTFGAQKPTPAPPRKDNAADNGASSAEEKPSISPDAAAPKPLDTETAPLKEVPPLDNKSESSSPYRTNSITK